MKTKALHILQLILIATAGFLAWAQNIGDLSFVPQKYAFLWPLLVVAAQFTDRLARLLGDFIDDWKLNDSFKLLLGSLLLAGSLTACTAGSYAGPPLTGGITYRRPDGSSVGVTLRLDDTFAREKK